MERISTGECQQQWSKVQELAIAEPVTITCNGHDRMVLMSTEEYSRLKRRACQVMTLDDFTAEDVRLLRSMQMPPEAAAFDHEVTD